MCLDEVETPLLERVGVVGAFEGLCHFVVLFVECRATHVVVAHGIAREHKGVAGHGDNLDDGSGLLAKHGRRHEEHRCGRGDVEAVLEFAIAHNDFLGVVLVFQSQGHKGVTHISHVAPHQHLADGGRFVVTCREEKGGHDEGE